jgi:hypothetical protein|tara:strand:- start:704 stop:904 length:201 start_codon:yes stop_codon:yes gene_type:complete
MREFLFALQFMLALVISILFLWAGVHLSFAYYMTDQNVHNVFAVFGPGLVLIGCGLPFAAIEDMLF